MSPGRFGQKQQPDVNAIVQRRVNKLNGRNDQMAAERDTARGDLTTAQQRIELQQMKIDQLEAVWTYQPEVHKNAFRDRERVIFFGPRAQTILRQFFSDRAIDAYLFSPQEAEAEHRARRRQARRTPLSCGNRAGTNRREAPTWRPGSRYTTSSYHRAIQYACDRAFPPPAPFLKRA